MIEYQVDRLGGYNQYFFRGFIELVVFWEIMHTRSTLQKAWLHNYVENEFGDNAHNFWAIFQSQEWWSILLRVTLR